MPSITESFVVSRLNWNLNSNLVFAIFLSKGNKLTWSFNIYYQYKYGVLFVNVKKTDEYVLWLRFKHQAIDMFDVPLLSQMWLSSAWAQFEPFFLHWFILHDDICGISLKFPISCPMQSKTTPNISSKIQIVIIMNDAMEWVQQQEQVHWIKCSTCNSQDKSPLHMQSFLVAFFLV